MMKIDKKELKIISYDFRVIASRLMGCNNLDGMSTIKKFINFIEGCELIFDYIKSTVKTEDDFSKKKDGEIYTSMGDTIEEEVSCTYQYLKYGIEKYENYYIGFAFRYSSGDSINSIRAFNNLIVLPFINHIEVYLTKIGIRMGIDEETKYLITINNESGQVNLSQDHSTINAVQNQNPKIEELTKFINAIKEQMDDTVSKADQETIFENLECIKDELKSKNPRKGLVRACIDGVNKVAPAVSSLVGAATAIASFIQMASSML